MQEYNKQITIEDLAEQLKNGNFNRQHDSYIKISKGSDGKILNDIIIKDGEEIEIYNKKQRDAFKKKMEKENAMREHIQCNEGEFVNFIYKYMCPAFAKLEEHEKCKGNKANIHIIRFIKLATHINFKNNLYDDNNNRIKKSSLSKIWDVKDRKGINDTYNLLKELEYIKETEEGYIMINESLIKKGDMENFKNIKKDDIDNTYTRLFSTNIQNMYLNTESKNRKQLANLFKILPYVNFKYNVFCENPIETDIDKIIPMTWTDLARVCGYEEKNHVTRFKKDLFKLKIYGYNVIGQFLTDSGYEILVNPKIYYSGDDIKDVEQLYAMFKMSLNKKTAI